MGTLLYFTKDMSHPIPVSCSQMGGVDLHVRSYCPMYPSTGLGTYKPEFCWNVECILSTCPLRRNFVKARENNAIVEYDPAFVSAPIVPTFFVSECLFCLEVLLRTAFIL